MRLKTLLTIGMPTLLLIGCSPTPAPSVCPKPYKMADPVKKILRDCCTVTEGKKRRPAPGTQPLWTWLKNQAVTNEQLEICRAHRGR